MELRELLLNKNFAFLAILLFLLSYNFDGKQNEDKDLPTTSFFVDTSMIKRDTVVFNSPRLILDNGIYYLDHLVFSGYVKKVYPDSSTSSIEGVYSGMLQGRAVAYYEGGKIRDVRMYKENKSFGKSYGYWEDGKMKFEYTYLNDMREGSNKQWYKSGQQYVDLNFKDDKEDGMQKAWRENGKPYINYEVRDGFRYGLQKSNLCYTLVDQKFKDK